MGLWLGFVSCEQNLALGKLKGSYCRLEFSLGIACLVDAFKLLFSSEFAHVGFLQVLLALVMVFFLSYFIIKSNKLKRLESGLFDSIKRRIFEIQT